MLDANEDTAVADFLEILEEHRKNCERQGKYVEAEIAKNRLDELKLHEENRRRVRFIASNGIQLKVEIAVIVLSNLRSQN
jgi:hypothetical protein